MPEQEPCRLVLSAGDGLRFQHDAVAEPVDALRRFEAGRVKRGGQLEQREAPDGAVG